MKLDSEQRRNIEAGLGMVYMGVLSAERYIERVMDIHGAPSRAQGFYVWDREGEAHGILRDSGYLGPLPTLESAKGFVDGLGYRTSTAQRAAHLAYDVSSWYDDPNMLDGSNGAYLTEAVYCNTCDVIADLQMEADHRFTGADSGSIDRMNTDRLIGRLAVLTEPGDGPAYVPDGASNLAVALVGFYNGVHDIKEIDYRYPDYGEIYPGFPDIPYRDDFLSGADLYAQLVDDPKVVLEAYDETMDAIERSGWMRDNARMWETVVPDPDLRDRLIQQVDERAAFDAAVAGEGEPAPLGEIAAGADEVSQGTGREAARPETGRDGR